jgi:hypothetical protein
MFFSFLVKINIIFIFFSVIQEDFLVQVMGEPVVKLNTGILKCVVPASMRHQADILSWRFGNNYIYPTKTWSSGK